MVLFKRRRKGAAGDRRRRPCPRPCTSGPFAGDAFAFQFQADALGADVSCCRFSSASRPTKVALVELDGPAQPGLQRIDVFGQLVAVERHGGFEPQRVARSQAAWLGPAANKFFPQLHALAAGTMNSKPSSPV